MGLDIYHVKLVLPSASTLDYLLVEDFKSNQLFLERDPSLIMEIGEFPDVDKAIYYEAKGINAKVLHRFF